MKHTPTPWHAKNWRVCANIDPNGPSIKVICDTAHNKATRTEENAANAEFIARACSAHEALVDAMRVACEHAKRCAVPTKLTYKEDFVAIQECLQTALASIKGAK